VGSRDVEIASVLHARLDVRFAGCSLAAVTSVLF
jgi:hypothetical protein